MSKFSDLDQISEIKTLTPETFPEPWACEWGQDEIGLWNTLMYKNVRQVFRWILPGKFLMGSPETEAERYAGREQQHAVIISKGYWMADTACTQALWEAVMGENPSHFKGAERPVERVSWDDAQRFIQKLNENVGEIVCRLPTEAEWEYACRAGTTTAFTCGENMTPEQANYDGENSYNNGQKGQYRRETVTVKSLPANPWVLYEMHGNIWEWCNDWFQEDYENDSELNPKGPESGGNRVVRGGSWIDFGRLVRSAYRNWFEPGYRTFNIGLRLALGH